MEWGFLEGIGIIICFWMAHRAIRHIVEENHEKTMQTKQCFSALENMTILNTTNIIHSDFRRLVHT